jgi:NAD-dependent histone deacetylase SIR2
LRGEHKLKGSGKHLFDASVYKHDSSTSSFHKMVRRMAEQISEAEPTPFHHLLASIAEEGRLLRLYTQNIDCIDTNMRPLATTVPLNNKGPWPKSVQLHGGLDKMVCSKCGTLEKFDPSLFEGPEPPPCNACLEQENVRITFAGKRSHGVGKLRPRIVLYNEHNPDQDAIGSVSKADLRRVPDAVIVVGTTLKIPGVRRIVKEMCQVTRSKRGGITAWINVEPEPQGPDLKDCWDLVVRGKCDDIAQLTNLPHWDEQDIGDPLTYRVDGDEQKEQRMEERVKRDHVDIELPCKRMTTSPEAEEDRTPHLQTPSMAGARSRMVENVQNGGIPTPSASPRHRSPLPFKTSGKTKQSKLVFGDENAMREVSLPKSAAAKKAARGRKPLTSSRGGTMPKNSLTGTFKATKKLAPTNKRKAGGDGAAHENTLPSLRPPLPDCVEFVHTKTTADGNGPRAVTPPTVDLTLRQSISPTAKSHSIECRGD